MSFIAQILVHKLQINSALFYPKSLCTNENRTMLPHTPMGATGQ